MKRDWWDDTFTTEGKEHWYLICIRSEAAVGVCGPFFDPMDAEQEAIGIEGERACELPHLTRKGPLPADLIARCRRPLIYEFHSGMRDWWEAWSYSPEGEKEQARRLLRV